MVDRAAPALAVIVVAYDNGDELASTLPAVVEQLQEGDDLIVVDCASPSGPPSIPERGRLARLGDNRGFAGGACAGAAETDAELLVFLNPDAVPAPGCMDALRAAAGIEPGWGAWQALVTMDGGSTVNSSGGRTHFTGISWAGGAGLPASGAARDRHEVAWASGAALAVRRAAWEEVGGFDPSYFMYYEDVDLSLRLRRRGWKVGIEPAACVVHDYEFHKGAYKWLHLERNRLTTVLSVYPARLLVLLAPLLVAFEVALLVVAARDGWLGAKLRAQVEVVRRIPAIAARQRAVEASSVGTPADFAGQLEARFDSPYVSVPHLLGIPDVLLGMYWKIVRMLVRSRGA